MKTKKTPQRICVGCQEFKDKRDLLRVVLTPEGELHIDRTGKAAGRGAYLCPNEECFAKAYKAKRLERSLKRSVNATVYESLKQEIENE